MSPELFFFLLGCVTLTFILVVWLNVFCERESNMEIEQALAVLLEAGASVEYRGWHVYKSRATVEYVLLNFNAKSELVADNEESFPDIKDAIAKFLLRTRV